MHDENLEEDFTPRRIAEEIGAAAKVDDHLEKDDLDACGYCGQFFGPEEVTVEREVHGVKRRFCDENCLGEFVEKRDFKDQNLDGDLESEIGVDLPEDDEEEN